MLGNLFELLAGKSYRRSLTFEQIQIQIQDIQMAEPLKNLYSEAFYAQLFQYSRPYLPDLDEEDFKSRLYVPEWEEMALKQRMRHTTEVWHTYMPEDYSQSVDILLGLSKDLPREGNMMNTLPYMVLGDYVEVYGVDHIEESFRAMEGITQFITCEFAIRPFLLRYQDEAVARMTAFAEHESYHVRRFASEGVRSRLPWGAAIPAFKKDPSPILPILKKLYRDESEWVRLSVSNNLNDICKDSPDVALALAGEWSGQSAEADKIVKHGIRTLLKKGDPRALTLIGLNGTQGLKIRDFKIDTPLVKLGENAEFSFTLSNPTDAKRRFRLEYGVDYQKANGTLSRKVFKISEGEIGAGEEKEVVRKQHFRPISTRAYHAGLHRIALIINGEEMEIGDLQLEM